MRQITPNDRWYPTPAARNQDRKKLIKEGYNDFQEYKTNDPDNRYGLYYLKE